MFEYQYLSKELNLNKIQSMVDKKIISQTNALSIENLKKAKIISKSFNKIKILGSGEIKDKVDLIVDYISKSAKEKLEKNGSKINLKKKI